MNRGTLVKRIRAMLARDELPRAPVQSIVASNGEGERCCVCARTIRGGDVRYAVDFGPGVPAADMHYGCFVLWEVASEAKDAFRPEAPASPYSQERHAQ